MKITVNPKPKADFLSAPQIYKINEPVLFENGSTGAEHFLWNFGDGQTSTDQAPVHHFSDTGYFDVTLTAISNQGCTDTLILKKYLHILPGYQAFIPNAFSPNDDKINQCFLPEGTEFIDFSLEIFTRWGNTIYKGNKCWDGNFNGFAVPEGMYIYHISITASDGSKHAYSGPFYLLR
jgi:gliding motility-associated-like protein